MRAGEVHLSAMPGKLLTEVVESIPGARLQPLGQPQLQVFYMAGNYWARTGLEGEDIFPRPGLKPDADHPWIGDPGECRWTEQTTTNDCLEANECNRETERCNSQALAWASCFGGI